MTASIYPVSAQNLSTASIDGLVTDQSGGALPGVTVTASSPALQVGQVSTVTDGEGCYRFVALPRGTLPAGFRACAVFKAFRREGLELTAGFAARVNATLQIGAVAETITVSGGSPIVDLTTTRGGQTINSTLLTTELPGSKTLADVISLSPGLLNTAGEVAGSLGLTGRPRFSAYGLQSGNTNITMMLDGFQIIANYPVPDTSQTDEVDVKTFGNTADIKEMGPAMNLVVKIGRQPVPRFVRGSVHEAALDKRRRRAAGPRLRGRCAADLFRRSSAPTWAAVSCRTSCGFTGTIASASARPVSPDSC